MKFEGGATVITSTGGKTILLDDDTINISEVFYSVEDPDDNGTVGWSDITNNYSYNALYDETSTTKALKHWKNVGGTKTNTLTISQTSGDFGDTGELHFNVDNVSSSVKMYFLVKGT